MSNEQINRKLDQALGKCLAGDECECIPTDYCGSIADAFALVEWMRKERSAALSFTANKIWRVTVYMPSTIVPKRYRAEHQSPTMAISLAALEALTTEEQQSDE